MDLRVAEHRPSYFLGGPGTIRMNLLKYEKSINKEVHLEAYQKRGVDKLKYMGINVVYAAFNWGFAPEIEREDWEWFRKFGHLCHENDIKVFAYIQGDNIVWKEWFKNHPESKKWISIDKRRKPMRYFQFGKIRYMCCYSNSKWLEHLKSMTRKALDYGADGIYYDNIHFLPCYCSACRKKFRIYLKERNLEPIDLDKIKKNINDGNYRTWRQFHCETTNNLYKEMRSTIDEVNPNIPMSSNTSDIVSVNKVVEHGCDSSQAIKIESLWMIENTTSSPHLEGGIEINNARTFKVAKALARDKLVSVLPYIPRGGLGSLYVSVYSPEEYKLAIAEASACQGAVVLKGAEYFDRYWTMITDDRFKMQQEAISQYNNFLASHRELYQETEYLSNIGLAFHLSSLSWTREKAFPSFCGFIQTLHQTNIPYEVLTEEDLKYANFGSSELIILPQIRCMSKREVNNLLGYLENSGKLLITGKIATHSLDGTPRTEKITNELLKHQNVTYFSKCPGAIPLSGKGLESATKGDGLYGSSLDFQLPDQYQKITKVVKELIKPPLEVKTHINESVFVWKKDRKYIIHLVNYDLGKTHYARIALPEIIASAKGFSPDNSMKDRLSFEGKNIAVKDTKIYDVVEAHY